MTNVIKRTFTQTPELDKELDEVVEFMNENRISGAISKSKLIRIALIDFIDRQKKIKALLEDDSHLNKSVEEILKENERL